MVCLTPHPIQSQPYLYQLNSPVEIDPEGYLPGFGAFPGDPENTEIRKILKLYRRSSMTARWRSTLVFRHSHAECFRANLESGGE